MSKSNWEKLEQQVGAMRQWLNEDRITEPKKLITNENIWHWLKEPISNLIQEEREDATLKFIDRLNGWPEFQYKPLVQNPTVTLTKSEYEDNIRQQAAREVIESIPDDGLLTLGLRTDTPKEFKQRLREKYGIK